MKVKQIIDKYINEYDAFLKDYLSNEENPQLAYNNSINASPMRQLITLFRFIDICEHPVILITNYHNSSVIQYNNEFENHIKYLGMCGIPINMIIHTDAYNDILRDIYKKYNTHNISIKYIYNLEIIEFTIPKTQGIYNINHDNMIVVYDKNNIKNQLVLSTDLILLSSCQLFENISNIEHLI